MASKVTAALFGLVWIALCRSINCLKDVHLVIPVAVLRGHDAVLSCHYDLEGDLLYAVKWYKGRLEFFRYIPTDRPRLKTFPLRGARVRMEASNSTHVYLEDVNEEAGGEYSCEISADAPSFYTKIETGRLNVVDLPKEDPSIVGLKLRYKLGDVMKANCTSGYSKPAANLTWYVNGSRLRDHHVHNIRQTGTDGFESTYSILRLNVNRQLFRAGRLKLRCVSRIFNVYHRSFEKSVELEKKKHQHPEENEHAYALKLPTTQITLLGFDDSPIKYEAFPAQVHKGDMTLVFHTYNTGKSCTGNYRTIFCWVTLCIFTVLR